jgi:hypothetical protein
LWFRAPEKGVIAFATGVLGAAGRQLLSLERVLGLTNLVSFLAAVTMVLSVAMIMVCARRWHKEYGGLGKSLMTFAVSMRIVVVYHGILIAWLWHIIRVPSAHT